MRARFNTKPVSSTAKRLNIWVLLTLSVGLLHAQELESERWKIGPLEDNCPSIWPLAGTTNWQRPPDTTRWHGDSMIGIRAFASGQFSPNVRAIGNGTARSIAEGLGWKAGMELAGNWKRFHRATARSSRSSFDTPPPVTLLVVKSYWSTTVVYSFAESNVFPEDLSRVAGA